MTIECYYSQCPKHSTHTDPDEGPFCFESECIATEQEIKFYAVGRRLERMGYNLAELEKDNPFNPKG